MTYVSVCGASAGMGSAIIIGGTAPYTYMWNNGNTTSSIAGLVQGTYEVTVTDINGCTQVGSAFVDGFENRIITEVIDPLYEAENIIETAGQVPIESGQNTTFRSQAIYLNQGLHAKQGAVFRAYIDPCNN